MKSAGTFEAVQRKKLKKDERARRTGSQREITEIQPRGKREAANT